MRTQRGWGIVNVTDNSVKVVSYSKPINLTDGRKRIVSFDKVGQTISYKGKQYELFEWWRDDFIPAGNMKKGFNSPVFSRTEIIETAKHEPIPPPLTNEERINRSFPQTSDMEKVIFEAFFEIVNRLADLEGGSAVTKEQLKTWMKNKL